MYYHAWNPHKSGWPFDAWAQLWLHGKVEFGSWFEHVKGWHAAAAAHPKQVLFIAYEDMKKQPKEAVRRIADFLSIDASPELIARVAEGSSFRSMAKQAKAGTNTPDAVPRGGASHLRKGKVGDWRAHFAQDTRMEFERVFAEQMAGTGLTYAVGGGEVLRASA